MGNPKKTKTKAKVKVKTKAQIKKKGTKRKEDIPRMKAQMPRTTGAVLKLKLKRKK